jgi:hypothetical protein
MINFEVYFDSLNEMWSSSLSIAIHSMFAREGNNFVFPRDSMFPETNISSETLSFEGKQNQMFPEGTNIKCLVI